MVANIQLDVIGTTIPTNTSFNVYSDVDGYASLITTKTYTELINGTTVNVSDGSTTIRLIPNLGCDTFIDISIDQGDLSPAITPQFDTTTTAFVTSVTGNKKSEIYIERDGAVRISTDNGDTFSSESSIPTLYNPITTKTSLLHNGTDLLLIALDSDSDTLKVYNVTNYTSGFNSATYTLIHSQSVPNQSITLDGTFYINNRYYISTSIGTYRSLSITDGFVLVLPEISFHHMDNYGQHVYAVKYDSVSGGGGVYKSIDNGLNWNYSYPLANPINIYVESFTKHIVLTANDNGVYAYSTDGGSNYQFTTISTYDFGIDAFVYKHNSVYILKPKTYMLYSPDLYTSSPTITQVGTYSGASNAKNNMFHPQRNTISFANQNNIHSYLITNT